MESSQFISKTLNGFIKELSIKNKKGNINYEEFVTMLFKVRYLHIVRNKMKK